LSGHSLLYLSLAGLAGLAMAIQGSINSVLGKKIGLVEATFVVHLTATLILSLFLIFNFNKGIFQLLKQVPWYLYLGGLIGVIITYTVVISIPKLGVAVATTAIVAAQVMTAVMIDHLGFSGLEEVPFNWLKLLGLFFLVTGVRLLLA